MAKNILIVDDSATMRKLIMRGLRQAGLDQAEFQQAADGIEGLQLLATGSFDLVLADVDLPRMDGRLFVEKVIDKVPNPPPIVMVATSAAAAAAAVAAGASGCLQQPLTQSNIQQVLGRLLP